METIKLVGAKREDVGRSSSKGLRREGKVPCVVYGGKENVHFSVDSLSLRDIVYTPNFYKVAIEVDGSTHEAILKDIQFHPVTDAITHVDFQELVKGKKVKTEIPVRLVGTPIGMLNGGKLQQKLRKLRVRVKPENMIGEMEVDVTELDLGSSVKVADIESGAIEVLDSASNPVATVMIPRALRSAGIDGEEGEGLEGEEGVEGEGAEGAEGAEGGADAEKSAED